MAQRIAVRCVVWHGERAEILRVDLYGMEAEIMEDLLRHGLSLVASTIFADLILHDPPAAGIIIQSKEAQAVHFFAVVPNFCSHRRAVQHGKKFLRKDLFLAGLYVVYAGSPLLDVFNRTSFLFQIRQVVF